MANPQSSVSSHGLDSYVLWGKGCFNFAQRPCEGCAFVGVYIIKSCARKHVEVPRSPFQYPKRKVCLLGALSLVEIFASTPCFQISCTISGSFIAGLHFYLPMCIIRVCIATRQRARRTWSWQTFPATTDIIGSVSWGDLVWTVWVAGGW